MLGERISSMMNLIEELQCATEIYEESYCGESSSYPVLCEVEVKGYLQPLYDFINRRLKAGYTEYILEEFIPKMPEKLVLFDYWRFVESYDDRAVAFSAMDELRGTVGKKYRLIESIGTNIVVSIVG